MYLRLPAVLYLFAQYPRIKATVSFFQQRPECQVAADLLDFLGRECNNSGKCRISPPEVELDVAD